MVSPSMETGLSLWAVFHLIILLPTVTQSNNIQMEHIGPQLLLLWTQVRRLCFPLCHIGFETPFSSGRSHNVCADRHHPHPLLCHWYVWRPGPWVDGRVHSNLHSILCEVFHYRCDRAGGSRAWGAASSGHYLSGLFRQGESLWFSLPTQTCNLLMY